MQRKNYTRRRITKEPVDVWETDSNDKPSYSYKGNNVVAHKQKSKEDFIKDIWNKHIEVQEQMLKARTAPIAVENSSIRIVGDKLFMSVNEQNRTDYIISLIANTFSIDAEVIKKSSGSFCVDIDKANAVDLSTKEQLSETAERNFVKFGSKPIVNGVIRQKIPNPLIEQNRYNNLIILQNGYLSHTILNELRNYNIVLENYSYIFHVDNELIIQVNNNRLFKCLPKKKDERGYSFIFKRRCKGELADFLFEYAKINQIFVRLFGNGNYAVNSIFEYSYQFGRSTLNEIESKLRESFPSMQFQFDNKNGSLYFFQEYADSSKYSRIVRSINEELSDLNATQFTYEVFKNPDGKEKYRFAIDSNLLQESLSDTIKSLRGSEFTVGDVNIGNLFRVNYPQLTFDISAVDKEVVNNLVEKNLIGYITPNLTGDLEKIARLKKSFDAISNGEGLQNTNLSEFIFDASKAKPIENIDYYTNPQSEYYNDINSNLLNTRINESQKQSIIKSLLAEDLALIQGPPGTGKSTAIAEIIWQHIRKNPNERILLTSETNLAVDNAIARVVNSSHNLVKPIRIGGEDKLEMEGKQFNLETLKQWVENGAMTYSETEDEGEDEDDLDEQINQKIILENWLSNIARRIDDTQMDDNIVALWKNIIGNPSRNIRQKVFETYIHNCNVVGATCSSIGDYSTKKVPTGFFRSYCELFGKVENRIGKEGQIYNIYSGQIRFDTVIQDESSKATPAELSLPLIYGKKNIIIGDHRQLPPMLDKEEFISTLRFLQNKTDDKTQLREIERLQKYVESNFSKMEISHFQRLFEKIDDSLKGVFNTQYRMHPAINEVIKQFYVKDGGLECGLDATLVDDSNMCNPQSRYHGIDIEGLVSPEKHVLWIDTQTPEMLVGTSRVNYGEVEAIRKVINKLQQSESFKTYQSFWGNDEDKQIGVISFYGKQLKLLRELRRDFRDVPIRISTVDRFQGMERNIIIVSMVRSNSIAADKDQQPDHELYGDLGFAEQNDLGFAKSPNRLNVALSRAKRLLIVVGNSNLFRIKEIYNNVFQCIENSRYGKIIKAEEL